MKDENTEQRTVKRKGGFPVRYFTAHDGTLIEASILKSEKSWRFRFARDGETHGFAFGRVADPVSVNREITTVTKMLGMVEVQP